MTVYRIAKSIERAQDLSGFGAFKFGGRWNSKGTHMLYTSMNSSLAFLENLVHFDEYNMPPGLYIASIEIKATKLIYKLPDADYPVAWLTHDNLENKLMGDEWMSAKKYLAIKVWSAVNPSEFNFLLNPLYPGYHDKVKIGTIRRIDIDPRLVP